MSAPSLSQAPLARATVLRTLSAMMAREIRVLRKSMVPTFAGVLIQPVMFVFVFAYVMPEIGSGIMAGGGSGATFSTVLLPGLVGSSVIMQAIQAVTYPLMAELNWQKSITDRALAPIPIPLLGIQKILAAALQGLIGGLMVFPAVLFIHAPGQAPQVHVDNWPVLVLVLLASAVLAAAGGLLLGTVMNPQRIQVVFALVLLPMTMLGCVYYPWAALEDVRWLQIVSLGNPLVYASEGLRSTLTPDLPHMHSWAFLLALLGGTALLTWAATRAFTRRVLT
ncbi:ABC transporter permease [Streptomyces rubradiris]|uniref:Transport permease protein n=1 Tax=Streptomyces rubradiris TaxID=285531 RepID=A0ABQ3RQN3_STRRR|nr:ABC transporter permease [Streptomyces rubradiris]GHH30741.1 transport permease protein [Streptomyces rubradiris]GHI58165.1 transport permease protein [Streptomyces rubradiris]